MLLMEIGPQFLEQLAFFVLLSERYGTFFVHYIDSSVGTFESRQGRFFFLHTLSKRPDRLWDSIGPPTQQEVPRETRIRHEKTG
jgi:hypothetical protein